MVKGVGMAEVVASLQTQHTVYDVKDLCSYFQSSKTFLQSAVKGKKASDVCRLERRNNNALDFFSLSVAAVSASVPQWAADSAVSVRNPPPQETGLIELASDNYAWVYFTWRVWIARWTAVAV